MTCLLVRYDCSSESVATKGHSLVTCEVYLQNAPPSQTTHNPLRAETSKDLMHFPTRCCAKYHHRIAENTITAAKEVAEH